MAARAVASAHLHRRFHLASASARRKTKSQFGGSAVGAKVANGDIGG